MLERILFILSECNIKFNLIVFKTLINITTDKYMIIIKKNNVRITYSIRSIDEKKFREISKSDLLYLLKLDWIQIITKKE